MKAKKVFSKRQNAWVWQMEGWMSGVQIRRGQFPTRKECDAAIAVMELRSRAHTHGMPIPASDVRLTELLEARASDPSRRSREDRRSLGYFEDFIEFLGSRATVREVTSAHLRAFRDSLVSHGYKPNTVNRRMFAISSPLNAAGIYFSEFESYRSPRLRNLRAEGRSTLVPRSELKALVDSLRHSRAHHGPRSAVADVLEMLQLTGARVGEICGIKADDIDWGRGILTIYAPKTRSRRPIPMTRSIEAIVRRRTKGFPAYMNVYHRMLKSRERGEVRFGRDAWVLHDIRHTAASVMAEAGISHSIIAQLLGHSLGGMTARYTHASLPALRQATLVLEAYWNGEQKRLQVVA